MRYLLPLLATLPVAWIALPASLQAQMPRGGDYVVADFSTKEVFVVEPSGSTRSLYRGAPLVSPSGMAVTVDGEVLVLDFSGTLYRIDAPGQITPVAGGLAGPIRMTIDRNGDYLVTELSASRLSRVTPAGVVTPIHQGAPFRRPFGVTVDPANGDILVVDDGNDTLFKVDASGVSRLSSGSPFRLPQGVAMFANGDYAVIDGLVDGVLRVPRGGGSATIVQSTPVLGNPCGIWSNFDGSVVVSESGAPNGNRVVITDPAGAVSIVASGSPFANLEAVARVPHTRGPRVGAPGASLSWTLDFPGQASQPYVTLLSASLYPGIPLTIGRSPIQPDSVFLSFVGVNNSVFQGFTGLLDANGNALATLNVPNLPIPPNAVLFTQVLALDLGQPSSLGALGNLIPVVF